MEPSRSPESMESSLRVCNALDVAERAAQDARNTLLIAAEHLRCTGPLLAEHADRAQKLVCEAEQLHRELTTLRVAANERRISEGVSEKLRLIEERKTARNPTP